MSQSDQRNPDFEFLMDDDGNDPFAYGEANAADTPEIDQAEDEELEAYEESYEEEVEATPPTAKLPPQGVLSDAVPVQRAAGSNLPLILGLGLTFSGIALGAAASVGLLPSQALERLVSLGLQPGLLFMTGIVLSGIGLGMRRSAQNSIQQFASRLSQEIDYLRSEVQTVTEQSSAARAAVLAQSVDGVQHMMAKQETMLGNLTKATRMFNKPLMDLATSVHDLERTQDDIKRNVLAIEKAQSDNIAGSEMKFEGLVEQLHTHTVNVQQTLSDALTQQGEKLIETVNQVLETSKLFAEESGKRFQSLEDGMLDVLSEQSNTVTERFSAFATQISKLEEHTKIIAERPAPELPKVEMPDLPDFDKIESSVREVQRAVEELSRRPAAVATGAPAATAAPAAAAAPAAKPAASPRPATGSSAEANPLPTPISGTKPSETGGKVLSAIEKLKALRGN